MRAAGGLVIADEVQAGYCRTGRWWGYEVTGFTPDIVVTGKPMGNGLPLAATAASRALVDGLPRRDALLQHLRLESRCRRRSAWRCSTSSSAMACARTSARVGAALKAALTERKARCAAIGDVRGHGLFIGVEMVKDGGAHDARSDRAIEVINRLKDKGFLTSNAGAFSNVVKIRPPLVFAQRDADEFLAAFDATIAENRWMKALRPSTFTPAALRGAEGVSRSSRTALELVSLARTSPSGWSTARDGVAYVLRLHRPWYHTLDELISERAWIRALDEAGIAVPAPLRTRDGREYVAGDDSGHRRTALRGPGALDRGPRARRGAGAKRPTAGSPSATSRSSAPSRRRCTTRRAPGSRRRGSSGTRSTPTA